MNINRNRFLALALVLAGGWSRSFAAEDARTAKHPDILKFTFADAKHGWIVARVPGSKLEVMRTADGGKSWTDATPGGKWPEVVRQAMKESSQDSEEADDEFLADTFAVFALDEKRVWIALGSGMGKESSVLVEKSDDGGVHWSEALSPIASDVFVAGIQFLDAAHGFILGSSDPAAGSMRKRIYSTADGGATWREMASPGGFGGYYTTGFAFSSVLDGWYTATYHGEPEVPVICTHDGSKTWKVQQLALPPGFKLGYGDTYAPQFFGKAGKTGVLAVKYICHEPKNDEMVAFYGTHDCGEQWTLAGAQSMEEISGEGVEYSFANERMGWFAVNKRLFSTHDGGRTWTEIKTTGIPAGSSSFLDQIQFVDEKNGWVRIAHNDQINNFEGQLLKTTDGGVTWSNVF